MQGPGGDVTTKALATDEVGNKVMRTPREVGLGTIGCRGTAAECRVHNRMIRMRY